ncbi:3-phosphoshikimate 1-carboxyvinyltransferase [Salinimonas marina]|uniref:3-phosphoshikimate 1-carboxyvinyltransferase n=1 Tax=Salinimonas marina TaxID=2785918 RepID=A0A7S9HD21_9ALTE|nr:3-phosphoshikimate 1-carboxyvinyltransferase [Salinimonas marina]QPG05101.1 3-phosphoshikimate 1-carboxyvinyltransferase [Salinimonas marina]
MYKIKAPENQSASLRRLLEAMPEHTAQSFSEEQLIALNQALGGRRWARHKVDIRKTIKFWRSSYYVVLLAGRNVRQLSRFEQQLSRLTLALFTAMLLLGSVLLGLVVLYLVKSALGINLFEDFSLGLWSWLQSKG